LRTKTTASDKSNAADPISARKFPAGTLRSKQSTTTASTIAAWNQRPQRMKGRSIQTGRPRHQVRGFSGSNGRPHSGHRDGASVRS
jgi:hypothetical protein